MGKVTGNVYLIQPLFLIKRNVIRRASTVRIITAMISAALRPANMAANRPIRAMHHKTARPNFFIDSIKLPFLQALIFFTKRFYQRVY